MGHWEGPGTGLWSGGFAFSDSIVFEHDGRPMLFFRQATVGEDGMPSHGEAGFVVAAEGGVVHVTVAEPTGVVEVLTGRVRPGVLEVRSVAIGLAPGASPVTAVARRLALSPGGDELVAEVSVAMNGEPLAPHTRSVLRRV